MSAERQQRQPEGRDPTEAAPTPAEERERAGAESYGGDPDTEPSITEEDVEAGMQRDQAEG